MSLLRRRLLLLQLAACVAVCTCVQNIDTIEPIVRRPPGSLNADGYFGYKVILHHTAGNLVPGSSPFNSFLSSARVIVGAPNGTLPNFQVPNPGVVYQCSIRQDDSCDPLVGSSNSGNDIRLFDSSSNTNLEEKSGQFMGGALASNGDVFVACGHRYVNFLSSDRNVRNLFGRCFRSDRSLSSFEEIQPCENVGRRSTSSVGVCQAGTSAAIAETSDGVSHTILSAPGTYSWRGVLIRDSPNSNPTFQQYSITEENAFGWQGYSVTKGHFRNLNDEDLATSVPRLNGYFGAVHILENNQVLDMVSQNLEGEQMGEYYGFSLAALNLAGDGLHELVVGAPLYRDRNIGAETGRVYIYQNIGGVLMFFTQLIGMKAYSRFGHAMVSLGDVSGDGFDDIAISAPFSDDGVVYIYHSSASQIITPTPQQTIAPSTLNLEQSLINGFLSFGTSLASEVDVDGNTYNDLAIGSYRDQSVVLLRTRPLAQIQTSFSSNPSVVNLDSGPQETFNGEQHRVFTITVCTQYDGPGLANNLLLNLNLTAETDRLNQGLQQRLFFIVENAKSASHIELITAQRGSSPQCDDFTVYVENDIADILNGFVIDLTITTNEFSTTVTNGNPNPQDLSEFPVVDIVGPRSVQVGLQNDCNDPCESDLRVVTNGNVEYRSSQGNRDSLEVGVVNEVRIPLQITNNGDNAYLAQLAFTLPNQQLGNVRTDDPVITCAAGNGNAQQTPYTCELGNPLEDGASVDLELRFTPSPSLSGEERAITLTFNGTSLNEVSGTMNDNSVTVTLPVEAEADIFLDDGLVDPDQVNHADRAPQGPIRNVTQLGPDFVTSFTVGNNGPSTIPEAVLTVQWPLRVKDSQVYYLYPTSYSVLQSTSVSVNCESTYFNPNGYDIASAEDISENQGGEPGVIGGRRRKRNAGRLRPRRRRQRNLLITRQEEVEAIPVSVERRISCLPEDINNANNYTCAPIICNIAGLGSGSRVRIDILAHVDERQLGGSIDSFTFIPSASVEIVNAEHITEPDDHRTNTGSAQFRSSPATLTVTGDGGQEDDETVPWYAIAIPIIAAVILIVVVAIVLYFCGFFRRKNKEELLQQAEENVAEGTGTDM